MTTLTIETDFMKVTKELRPDQHESYETCDIIIREFMSLLVASGWMPGSIKDSVVNLGWEYEEAETDII